MERTRGVGAGLRRGRGYDEEPGGMRGEIEEEIVVEGAGQSESGESTTPAFFQVEVKEGTHEEMSHR